MPFFAPVTGVASLDGGAVCPLPSVLSIKPRILKCKVVIPTSGKAICRSMPQLNTMEPAKRKKVVSAPSISGKCHDGAPSHSVEVIDLTFEDEVEAPPPKKPRLDSNDPACCNESKGTKEGPGKVIGTASCGGDSP
jgi:hypothetical protein